MYGFWRYKAGNFLAVVLFLSLAFYYRSFIPLFETPDEPSHFSVIKYIADNNQLPQFPEQFREGPVPLIEPGLPQYYAPPLYYGLMSLLMTGQNTDAFFEQLQPNPDFGRQRGLNFTDNYSSKNMYVHTFVNHPSADWVRSFDRIRLFSILMSATAVYAAVLIGKKLWPTGNWYLAPALLLSLNSSFVYLSNGVSNDPFLIALCSWIMYLALVLLEDKVEEGNWRLWLLVGLISLALLTKQTAVIFIPILLLVIFSQADWTKGQKWRALFWCGLLVGVIGGSWYWRNVWQTGDLVALSSHRSLLAMVVAERFQFFVQQLPGTFKSYWASYGWATIFVANGWYLYFGLLTVVGFTGWILPTARSWPNRSTLLLWGLLGLNGALMIFWLWRTAAPYGRLLYPTIIPLYCVLVEGWKRFLEKLAVTKVRIGVQAALILPIALLAIRAPSQYIAPAFASPLQNDLSALSYTSANVEFGESIQLVGYRLPEASLFIEEPVHLTLFWQSTAPIEQNYLLNAQVSLLNIEERVATLEHWLGTARYPSSVWQNGPIIRQEVIIQVDDTAVAPALYWVNLSVRDVINNQALPVSVDGIQQENQIGRVGPFRFLTSTPNPLLASNPTLYTFADAIQLKGIDVQRVADQAHIEVQLHWESLAPIDTDQTVFVHMIDANQKVITQSDQKPLAGNYPTLWWQTGDFLIDSHYLPILSSQSLEGATLLIGMYEAGGIGRLPIVDQEGREVPNGAIIIPLNP